jgi:DNA-directed RNA polymerase sigma subunit (sigma70/sigma32)
MANKDSDPSIRIYLREIGQVQLLTPQEEIDLAARIKKGDREARTLMIKANLRLVVKIAHDYANLGLPLLDLVSEGNIGLMKAVERFDPASIRPTSLNAPINEDDSTEFGDLVGDENARTPFESLRDRNLRDQLADVLQVLDAREHAIILQRFGLDGARPRTLEEVGKKLGVTRERIRQVQNIALTKLRQALRKKDAPYEAPGEGGSLTDVTPGLKP